MEEAPNELQLVWYVEGVRCYGETPFTYCLSLGIEVGVDVS